jgi:hypothetical protein
MARRYRGRAIPVWAFGRGGPGPACICARASVMLNGVDGNAQEETHDH